MPTESGNGNGIQLMLRKWSQMFSLSVFLCCVEVYYLFVGLFVFICDYYLLLFICGIIDLTDQYLSCNYLILLLRN